MVRAFCPFKVSSLDHSGTVGVTKGGGIRQKEGYLENTNFLAKAIDEVDL